MKSKKSYFKSPVFIMGSPRSGTTLTYLLLASSPGVWSTFDEDNPFFDYGLDLRVDPMRDSEQRGVAIDERSATPERCQAIYSYFWQWLSNPAMFGVSGFEWGLKRKLANRFSRTLRKTLRFPVTMVHKNTRNTFRIPFIRAVFPNARFVFVFRDGRANISSLIEGWTFKRFQTFRVPLPDVDPESRTRQWAFELPPNWKAWANRSVAEVCAFQWVAHNEFILAQRNGLPAGTYANLRYEDLVSDTSREIDRLCEFLDLPVGRALKQVSVRPKPVVETSLPQRDKWLKRKEDIQGVRDVMQPMMDRLGYGWE